MRQILRMALVAALAVVGCKKQSADSGAAAAGGAASSGNPHVLIGMIGKSRTNAVFQAASSGARDAGQELGAKYNADVEIDDQTPVDENAQKQSEAIDMLVQRGAKGIAVSASDSGTLVPAVDRAVDAGVAVMFFDSDAPKSKRQYFYGADDITCGVKVMQELATAMGDKGTIAILAGSASAPNLQNRVKGVRQELANHPNVAELLNGKGVFNHEETPEKAAEAVQQAQTVNTSITGWAMVGGWPLFTRDALKWPAGSVKVVAVDALPAELIYLKNGYVDVLLAQDCYGWGYKSVDTLLNKIVNKQEPPTAHMIDPLTRVTKDNADEYAKNWDKWLKK